MENTLARFLQKAVLGKAEADLRQLIELFGASDKSGTLSNLVSLNNTLSALGFYITPGFEKGDLDTVRRVVPNESSQITPDDIRDELSHGETENIELKSSLLYDHARAKHHSGATPAQLKSEAVLYSSLKTLAAFLNCSGGILYIGIDDEKNVLGIEHDFACITDKVEKRNVDHWELHLRDQIQGKFKDGVSVNDYISCFVSQLDNRFVARIEVSPRSRLAFLTTPRSGWAVYRRQGNRTTEVTIDLLEEFIEYRKLLRA